MTSTSSILSFASFAGIVVVFLSSKHSSALSPEKCVQCVEFKKGAKPPENEVPSPEYSQIKMQMHALNILECDRNEYEVHCMDAGANLDPMCDFLYNITQAPPTPPPPSSTVLPGRRRRQVTSTAKPGPFYACVTSTSPTGWVASFKYCLKLENEQVTPPVELNCTATHNLTRHVSYCYNDGCNAGPVTSNPQPTPSKANHLLKQYKTTISAVAISIILLSSCKFIELLK